MQDVVDPDVGYLESVYSGLGVTLGEAVQRRFDEVQAFHSAVVRNRRNYLEDEVTALRDRLSARASEREQLGEVHARLLRLLNEGGALESLNSLQQALATARVELVSVDLIYFTCRTRVCAAQGPDH